MSDNESLLAVLSNRNLAEITSADEARKVWVLSTGLTVTLAKIYNSIKKDAKVAKEDKERAYEQAVSASDIQHQAEARLGELIREEQAAGKLRTQKDGKRNLPNSPESNNGVTLKDIGLTKMDSSRAQLVSDNRELWEDIKQEAIKRKDIPTRRDLEKKVKQIKHAHKIAELRNQIKELKPVDGKFDVIVFDPPWPYGTVYDAEGRRAASPYPEVSLEKLKEWNIPHSEDCVLWLWTTNHFMHEAYHLLEFWEFEPKTILTWVKDRFGLGSWLRGQTEHCIMAIHGSPQITLTNQSTIIYGNLREHSRKPDEFYELVDSLCLGSKTDYFSREKREGWVSYGTLELEGGPIIG